MFHHVFTISDITARGLARVWDLLQRTQGVWYQPLPKGARVNGPPSMAATWREGILDMSLATHAEVA